MRRFLERFGLMLAFGCALLGLLLVFFFQGGLGGRAEPQAASPGALPTATPQKAEELPDSSGKAEPEHTATSAKVPTSSTPESIEMTPTPPPKEVDALRAAWVQASSITTPEGADEVLSRLATGGYNAVLANVVAYGHAFYESELLDKHPDVAQDFDPLAYLVEQAHKRGIAVHAWLVAGPLSYDGEPGRTFTEHPEWAMVGPDGMRTLWLNYTRPDVRRFLGDVVVELVDNYGLDGVHFDYTRYPGAEWGFDDYSVKAAAAEPGLDLELLRYDDLPAYATFRGNPLAEPDTAQVLAVFSDGVPAVLLNRYGKGTAIVLNWDASERQVAAGSVILDRSVEYLLAENGKATVLYSEANTARYGSVVFEEGMTWLQDLGWEPVRADTGDLAALGAGDVVVLQQIYLLDSEAIVALADFVDRGGGAIFLDGPVSSIEDPQLQALLGVRAKGTYFQGPRLMLAVAEHDIIPSSERSTTLKEAQALDREWKAFREQGINKLLEQVYQRVKVQAPDAMVTITVSGDQRTLNEKHLLDWESWLKGGYVDLIIPRAYVGEGELLMPVLDPWRPAMEGSGRVAAGLKVYTPEEEGDLIKKPERILGEIELAEASGSQGIVLFDLEHVSDEMLEALAKGWPEPSMEPTPGPTGQ